MTLNKTEQGSLDSIADTERTGVSAGGSTVVPNTEDINFNQNLSVSDDGDGTATVDASGGGGSSWTQTTKTSDYTAADNDSVWADASSSAVTITLPSPSANLHVRVTAIDDANGVTLSENGAEGINDQSGTNSTISMTQGESIVVESDGSTWWVVG